MSSSFRRGGKKTLSSKNKGVRPARASSPSASFGRKTTATKTSALPISGRATSSTSASFPGSSTNSSAPSSVFERIGTKPWVGGLTLTSSGLRELDAIYGGGQPLGTAVLVEEDRWTQDLALALVRYWSAEVSKEDVSASNRGSPLVLRHYLLLAHYFIRRSYTRPSFFCSSISLSHRELHKDNAFHCYRACKMSMI